MRTIFSIIILSFLASKSFGQDYALSNPFDAPILLNPANTGVQYPIRAVLNYRQQWKSITNPFTTILASFDSKAFSQNNTGSSLGIGLSLADDNAGYGNLNTLNINLHLSGKVMLNDNQNLSLGICGGVMQRSVDVNKLTFTDQYDGYGYNSSIAIGESFATEKRIVPDIGTGIQWSYGRGATTLSSNDAIGAQLGFAAFHVNMPNTGFQEDVDKRYIRMVMHGSFSYGIKNTPFQLNPSILVEMQGPARMYFTGLLIKYRIQESSKYTGNLQNRTFNIGAFYRYGDAITSSVQLEWDMFVVGFSYDFNISMLKEISHSRGANEIFIKYIPMKKQLANRLL